MNAEPRAYYNEIDKFAAEWLRILIADNLIANGDVDERSIADVRPEDLDGYTQCHFFAGIGGWSLALRLAGWPDDRPVWTGSCPCQGYSAAGKGKGAADARNLWPEWFRLIRKRRPRPIFGEQVTNAVRHGWIDHVSTDLEAEGYAVGPVVLGAHSVGSPNIRQRLWFVSDAEDELRRREQQPRRTEFGRAGSSGGRADLLGGAVAGSIDARESRTDRKHESARIASGAESHHGRAIGLGYGLLAGLEGRAVDPLQRTGGGIEGASLGLSGRSPWTDPVWLLCRDGKARPTESVLQSVAHGLPDELGYGGDPSSEIAWLSPLTNGATNRRGRLAGYGNAINPYVAAEVIAAYMEIAG